MENENLSDSEIKGAIRVGHFVDENGKPIRYKLDGKGLGLEISDHGTACWRMRYINPKTGKPARISLGLYPTVGLKAARIKAHKVREQVDKGDDPSELRREKKTNARARLTFGEVIAKWFEAYREHDMTRSAKTRIGDKRRRDQLIELFGNMMIDAITSSDIQEALIKIANVDGHKCKARDLRRVLYEVFVYAIPKKYCTANPAAESLFKLPQVEDKAHPAIIAPGRVGELMRDIAAYDGRLVNRVALEVLARTFPRPHNVREMQWDHISDDGVWSIPYLGMKMRRPHRVPLSTQVLALLDLLRPITGGGKYVFSTKGKPMTPKTINRALRKMGYPGDEIVGHGFRSTASTLLNRECRWPSVIIELQLAHGNEDKVAKIYNRAVELDAVLELDPDETDQLWAIRCKLMQHWSDRLDAMRDKPVANVVPLKVAA